MTYADPDTSAMWFLTRTQDADAASAFWRGLGQELDLETYVATPNELSAAPFPVFVCEQVVGDLILIPSRACHQVRNLPAPKSAPSQDAHLAPRAPLPGHQ